MGRLERWLRGFLKTTADAPWHRRGFFVRSVVVLLALTWPARSSLDAQEAPASGSTVDLEEIRAYLIRGFERNRDMDLAYLAAAPDSMLRWAPTEGVRDFAQQMAHTTHNFFRPWRSDAPADSAVYLNDARALGARLDSGYAWAINHVRTASHEVLVSEQEILGEPRPLWRVMQYWLDHAMWTRASVIPYLRLNSVTPPPVRFW